MPLPQNVQRLAPGVFVELYELDARPLGGDVYGFVDPERCAETVYWAGTPFIPFGVRMEGFETAADGPAGRPRLYLTNVLKPMRGAIEGWNKLRGAKISRFRTFREYLDDGATPDTTAYLPISTHYLAKVLEDNKYQIGWECAPEYAITGTRIPNRQILRTYCPFRYRIYSGGGFSYAEATCPYTGTQYFDVYGESVPIDEDRCGKKLRDCKLRFPGNLVLPFGGFPGAGRYGR